MSFFTQKRTLLIVPLILVSVFVYSTTVIIFSQFINWYLLQLFGWASWFIWLSVFFDFSAKIVNFLNLKEAFGILMLFQVIPGVSFFATMMLLPGIYAFHLMLRMDFFTWQFSCGLLCCLIGLAMVIVSFKTIGLGGAAFERDYSLTKSKELITTSIYGYIRHPLYLGAVIGSLGISLMYNNWRCYIFSLISILFLPVYKYLEEKRLISVYGGLYYKYQREVGAFWPKRRKIKELFHKLMRKHK